MDMDEKICMITGANTGIGFATAKGLAEMNATVIMVCRDTQRGIKAKNKMIEDTGNEQIELFLCDLSSLESIRRFSSEFKEKYQDLHVLVNNAGVMLSKWQSSVDGYEMNFAINTIAPFLLTNLLLDMIKKSAPSRIINVASAAHKFGTIDFDDLQSEHKKRKFMGLYGTSKLALMLITYELSRILEGTGVTVNAVHPGVVNTNLGVDRDNPKRGIVRRFFKSPERGAETSIFLASSPEVEGITGKYFIKKKVEQSSETSYDVEVANKLWEKLEVLVGLKK